MGWGFLYSQPAKEKRSKSPTPPGGAPAAEAVPTSRAWGPALPSLFCCRPCSEPNLSFANLQGFCKVPALLPALRTLSDILPGGSGKSDGSRRQRLVVISLGGGGNGTDKLFPTNLLSYFKIPGWQQKCWMAARVRKMLSLDRVRPDLSPPQICRPRAE